jgi:hypothetical protein
LHILQQPCISNFEIQTYNNSDDDDVFVVENNNCYELHEGQSFISWKEFEQALVRYEKFKGFASIVCGTDIAKLDRGVILAGTLERRRYCCEHSDKYIPKKSTNSSIQRPKQSKKCECPFRINSVVNASSGEVNISKMTDSHNHELDPQNLEFSTKYRRISHDVMQKIKFYAGEVGIGS